MVSPSVLASVRKQNVQAFWAYFAALWVPLDLHGTFCIYPRGSKAYHGAFWVYQGGWEAYPGGSKAYQQTFGPMQWVRS